MAQFLVTVHKITEVMYLVNADDESLITPGNHRKSLGFDGECGGNGSIMWCGIPYYDKHMMPQITKIIEVSSE